MSRPTQCAVSVLSETRARTSSGFSMSETERRASQSGGAAETDMCGRCRAGVHGRLCGSWRGWSRSSHRYGEKRQISTERAHVHHIVDPHPRDEENGCVYADRRLREDMMVPFHNTDCSE